MNFKHVPKLKVLFLLSSLFPFLRDADYYYNIHVPFSHCSGEDTNVQAQTTGVDYFHGGASGGGKPTPIVEPEKAKFFIVQASTQADLAISTVRGEWYIQKKHVGMLNRAYNRGKTQVMIFFTVSDSRHVQGAALMTSEATSKAPPEQLLQPDYIENQPNTEELFSYTIELEWFRTTEFPIKVALEAAPDLILPTPETSLCQEMSNTAGEQLMKAVWNAPLVTLYESWSENDNQAPPALDALLTDFRCPPPDEVAWPVSPQPGFIFGCSSDTMDECLGRGIFGMPKDMWASAQHAIAPGSTIFLFNVTDRLLFGIFEALTPARMNIEARAFSKNPNATSSPFPVQVRVRVSLECPPLEDTDEYLNDILRSRGKSRIGPLTFAQTEAIASLMADQCGALTYMLDYQDSLWDGRNDVPPPPIALPPRKIQRPDSSSPPSTA
jgi:cleavage and polyadenylation specificity factor subunit 4